MKTWKDRIKDDYSWVRGVCHNPDPEKSQEQMEKELGYAQRLNLNSVRFWLEEEKWAADPAGYEAMILNFVRTCMKYDIYSMPILWNGNFITDYQPLTDAQLEEKKRYADAIIRLLKGEPGLLMWDIYNEPLCNDYLILSPAEEYEERRGKIAADLRKLCLIVRELDDDTPITVGHESANHLDTTADLVDVISFHDYLPTRRQIRGAFEGSIRAALEQGGKPVLNTETGCVGRANPYDVELEMCEHYHCGFYLFNLVIQGFWGGIHGLVYPDGTIRDPGIIAALFGFYRNRTENRILPDGNREEHVYKAVEKVESLLKIQRAALFLNKEQNTDELLDAAEYCVNILESCELVPMYNLMSAQLECWRRQAPEERDLQAIKRFAFEAAKQLKEEFLIL